MIAGITHPAGIPRAVQIPFWFASGHASVDEGATGAEVVAAGCAA